MIESKSPKGKRMSNEEIAKLGILTNSVSIKVNEKKFFRNIVSYPTIQIMQTKTSLTKIRETTLYICCRYLEFLGQQSNWLCKILHFGE